MHDRHLPRCSASEEQKIAVVGLSTIAQRRERDESTDFLPRTNTSVDLVDNFSADHLVEDDPSARIQHLFIGSSV